MLALAPAKFQERVLKLITDGKTAEAREWIDTRQKENSDEDSINYKFIEKRLKQAQ